MDNNTKEVDNKNIASNDETKRYLAELRKKVKESFPCLSYIVDYAIIEDKGSGTQGGFGATDGTRIELNVNAIKDEDGVGILAHEAFHILRHDIEKFADKDQKLGNVVADAAINDLIRQQGVRLDHGGVDISSANDIGAEKLYDMVVETMEFIKQDNYMGVGAEITEAYVWTSVMGDHEKWEKVVKYHDEKEKEQEQNKDKDKKKGDEIDNEQEADESQKTNMGRQPEPEPEMAM
jgi:hypothetical protein